MSATSTSGGAVAQRYGSGAVVRRLEDPALLRGQGQFTDDVVPAGQTCIAFVRSMHAHARLLAVDTVAARAMPGVFGVWTGADLLAAGLKPAPLQSPVPRADGSPGMAPERLPLAHERVRFVGEPIVAIVAASANQARAAAAAVNVDYEPLPALSSAPAAMQPGAPRLDERLDNNVCAEVRHGDAAAAAAAFARAAHRVKLSLVNQRLAPVTMEPRAVLAWIDADSGRLTLRAATQMPTALREGVAATLGMKPTDVRVVVGDVGGGFGMKTGPYAEDLMVAFTAWTLKRPVKWQSERLEDFCAAGHGRDQHIEAELALDADGRVLALRAHTLANVGAYPTTTSVLIPLLIGPWVVTSVYDIRVIELHQQAVLTNSVPTGAYRGAGRPESIYLIERLMDAAAQQIGIDPAELRRRNLVRAEQMPYTNPMGQVYDCGQFERMLDQGLALADWKGFDARAAASRAGGKLRGRSVTTFLEWTGGMALEETATVKLQSDGTIEIFTATQAMGQGIVTSYAQLACDIFDVPLERIRIVQGDTDRGNGFGSAASRSLFTGGPAVQVASRKTLDEARERAAEALEAAAADLDYRSGRFVVAGTDLGIDLGDVAAQSPEGVLVVAASASASGASWPNGCHVCEVEVDADTGEVRIVAYSSVNDIGRIVSPQIVRGQIDGGAVQGIGQALSEQIVYDPASGQLLTASFMDYALPRADGFVGFKTEFDTSVPCTTNALGAKGVGEVGTIGATPAVVNAVLDALLRAGVPRERVYALQMPLLAGKVWAAIKGG